jgi:hypothetical protein
MLSSSKRIWAPLLAAALYMASGHVQQQQPQPPPVTVTKNNVAVSGGIFTVKLDFGESEVTETERS